MSALASSSRPVSDKKQEATPVKHCKGVNDLDKVMLHEVRGSFVEVSVCHSHESPAMFRLPDPGADLWRLPWLLPCLSLPYVAYVCFKCFRHFSCMLQK
jgi:hypothetical protein